MTILAKCEICGRVIAFGIKRCYKHGSDYDDEQQDVKLVNNLMTVLDDDDY